MILDMVNAGSIENKPLPCVYKLIIFLASFNLNNKHPQNTKQWGLRLAFAEISKRFTRLQQSNRTSRGLKMSQNVAGLPILLEGCLAAIQQFHQI